MIRFADVADALVSSGYRPIPIKPNQKAPAVQAWQHYVYASEDRSNYRQCGVGLLCGELRAIDIDVRNEQVSARLEALAKSMLNIDGKAPRRIGQWPKTLLMVRSDDGPKMSTAPYRLESDLMDDKPHKVEILGAGQQFVAYGTHPDTGREYTWNGAGDPTTIPFDSLPYVDPAELHAFLSAAEGVLAEYGTRCGKLGRDDYGTIHHSSGDLAGDYLTVASAVRAIPNADLSRDDWITMGHAIKGALGEQGRSLWLEWSRSSSKSGMSGKADSPEKAWDSFKPTKIGAGTIYYEAKRHGWTRPGPVANTPAPPTWVDEAPPLEGTSSERPQADERKDGQTSPAIPTRNHLDWTVLAKSRAPKFEWIWQDWLSWHPTLLAGRGGIGKSLFTQQLATALATGADSLIRTARPLRVLYWACEDDTDELWRRQERICYWQRRGLDTLGDLHIDARMGLENTLYSLDYGRPVWTGLLGELEQQVNDLNIDVLFLDNIGQIYGANENDRHHVTTFTNGIAGIVRGRPFCPVFLGHPAKDSRSEYAGNAAWENAVRMRWFLSDRMPDEEVQEDDDQPDPSIRFLCKRKANYATKDVLRFRIEAGVMKPELEGATHQGSDSIDKLYDSRAESTVLEALDRIAAMGKTSSDTPGPSYLPKQIMALGLNAGTGKKELERAMNRLLKDGKMRRAEVGRYANRTPKFGLIRTGTAQN